MTDCIVCNTPNVSRQSGEGDFSKYECPRCGAFVLSGTAEAVLESQLTEVPLRRSLMSHTLRRMQLPQNKHLRIIGSDELPSFWSDGRLPTPLEQADKFILWLGDNQETPSTWALTTAPTIAATIGIALMPGGDSQGWGWLHSQLERRGLYLLTDGGGGQVRLMLTMHGWERYEQLRKQRLESRIAFMAMKFNDVALDRAVRDCFKPAVVRAGFELRVLTDQQAAGLIDDQIRAALLSARFVVADLTHGSHGAYWEAGFAEGRGIPVIYTCEIGAWEKNKPHFDTNHLLTILWDPNDLKKAENALASTVRATLRAEAKQTDE
jgi:nucleoside 2-deoxyribosyltransferase